MQRGGEYKKACLALARSVWRGCDGDGAAGEDGWHLDR